MVSLYTANIHGFPELGEWQHRSLNGSVLGVGGGGDPPADLLSLITIIGSSMSLVGLVFGFLVHSLFSDVRSIASTALMNLLATLFVAQVLFIIQVEKAPSSSPAVCLGLACSLRFFWLAMFAWVGVLAHHLLHILTGDKYSTRAVVTISTPIAAFPSSLAAASYPAPEKRNCSPLTNHVLTYSATAWGIPLFLSLAAALLYQQGGFHVQIISRKSFRNCWLLSAPPLRWTFDIPVALLTTFNIYAYVKTAVAIRYVASMQMERKIQKRMRRRRFRQLFLLVKLHALLGIIWALEMISDFAGSQALWSVFVVVFSLQGGFIALVYSCSVKVMKFYAEGVLSDWKHHSKHSTTFKKSLVSSSMSLSSSMELLTSEPTPQPL
uniref:G-protein coupled receptors family 2 profile 2 domain-containing protein n=1 Tax=Strigamia maritima TaxID=126957 RepID=T1ISF7_STRMM